MKIDITHKFTDEHFREFIQECLGSEIIYQEDVEDVEALDISACDCKELNGLECFTGLRALSLWWNDSIAWLTMPRLPSLEVLLVQGNASLASLVIPKLPSLEVLEVKGNASLASLVIPELPSLEELYVRDNYLLTALTLSQCLKSIATIKDNHPDINIKIEEI